jgi:hypothetical protein
MHNDRVEINPDIARDTTEQLIRRLEDERLFRAEWRPQWRPLADLDDPIIIDDEETPLDDLPEDNTPIEWPVDATLAREAEVKARIIPLVGRNLRGMSCSCCRKPFNTNKSNINTVILFGVYTHAKCLIKRFYCARCGIWDDVTEESPRRKAHSNPTLPIFEQEYCKECASKLKNCEGCGEEEFANNLVTIRNKGFCGKCAINCNYCGDWFLANTIRTDHTGHKYCPRCWERRNFILPHDFDPMTVLAFKGNPKDHIYYGIELEIEVPETLRNRDLARTISLDFSDFVVTKHDGSLQNGFEVVTCPASMEEQIKFWTLFFTKGYEFTSYESPRCSMHVHMSRKPISPNQLARMQVFMYSEKNRKMIETIAGRNLHTGWGTRYAEILNQKKLTDVVGVRKIRKPGDAFKNYVRLDEHGRAHYNLGVNNPQSTPISPAEKEIYAKNYHNQRERARYTALNDTNPNTIEIRIFRGCNLPDTIFKNLEFCKSLIDYCRPGTCSFIELEAPDVYLNFIKCNRHQYRTLYCYLKEQGLYKRKVGK